MEYDKEWVDSFIKSELRKRLFKTDIYFFLGKTPSNPVENLILPHPLRKKDNVDEKLSGWYIEKVPGLKVGDSIRIEKVGIESIKVEKEVKVLKFKKKGIPQIYPSSKIPKKLDKCSINPYPQLKQIRCNFSDLPSNYEVKTFYKLSKTDIEGILEGENLLEGLIADVQYAVRYGINGINKKEGVASVYAVECYSFPFVGSLILKI
jgi:hypothetical protein